MSVWQNSLQENPSLSGSEGELVCVSIAVEARYLESLLEALAQADFPINPQIYHDSITIVEFPAYAGQLPGLRRALEGYGFDGDGLSVTSMIEELRSPQGRHQPRRLASGSAGR